MTDGSIGQEEVRIQTDPDSASHRLCLSFLIEKNETESVSAKKKKCYKTHRSFKDTVTFLETVENSEAAQCHR